MWRRGIAGLSWSEAGRVCREDAGEGGVVSLTFARAARVRATVVLRLRVRARGQAQQGCSRPLERGW